jgi:toxin ParE1/3/4
MAYAVKTTPHPERDLIRLYKQINAEFSETAIKWYLGIREAILSLEQHPNRCPITRRQDKLRNLLYGHRPNIYRVIYWISERKNLVDVLRVRHGARGKLKKSDIM